MNRPGPYAMTPRARGYLLATGSRHLVIGGFTAAQPAQYQSPVFIPIISAVPLWGWGTLFLIAGTICVVATILRSRSWARAGLIASAAITGVAAAGLWLGVINQWAHGGTATVLTATLLSALTAKDLIVCAQPMSTPFEEYVFSAPRSAPHGN